MKPIRLLSTLFLAMVAMAFTAPVRAGVDANGNVIVTVSNPSLSGATDTSPTAINITAADVASSTATGANSQSIITGTPTTSSSATFAVVGIDTVNVQATGTWAATLQSEVSFDGGTTWYIRGFHQIGSSYTVNTATAKFGGILSAAGMTNYRIRCTAYTSGTATIKITGTVNPTSVYVANRLMIADPTTPTQGLGVDANGRVSVNEGGIDAAAVLTSAARTSTTTSTSLTNYNGKTAVIYLNVTVASGTGGLTLRILGVDPVSGSTFPMNAAPSAVLATGQYSYVIGPGCTSTGGSVAQATATLLPRTYQIQVTHGDASSYTYSVGASISN